MTRQNQERDWVEVLTSPAPLAPEEPRPGGGKWTMRDSAHELATGAEIAEIDTIPSEFLDLFRPGS